MAREIDLTQRLSEEDREYLLARGKEQLVFANDAEHTGDPEAVAFANYVPGTSIDRADGVPPTPGGDPLVVMGGGTVEGAVELEESDEDDEDDEEPSGESEDNYESWDKAALKEELANRELATSGNKAEMIARLREDDEDTDDESDE